MTPITFVLSTLVYSFIGAINIFILLIYQKKKKRKKNTHHLSLHTHLSEEKKKKEVGVERDKVVVYNNTQSLIPWSNLTHFQSAEFIFLWDLYTCTFGLYPLF